MRWRTLGVGALLLLAVPVPVGAGSWTLTSTAEQDAALRWVVKRQNAERLKQNQPTVTDQEYLQVLFNQALHSYQGQKQKEDEQQMADVARECVARGKTWSVVKNTSGTAVGTCQ